MVKYDVVSEEINNTLLIEAVLAGLETGKINEEVLNTVSLTEIGNLIYRTENLTEENLKTLLNNALNRFESGFAKDYNDLFNIIIDIVRHKSTSSAFKNNLVNTPIFTKLTVDRINLVQAVDDTVKNAVEMFPENLLGNILMSGELDTAAYCSVYGNMLLAKKPVPVEIPDNVFKNIDISSKTFLLKICGALGNFKLLAEIIQNTKHVGMLNRDEISDNIVLTVAATVRRNVLNRVEENIFAELADNLYTIITENYTSKENLHEEETLHQETILLASLPIDIIKNVPDVYVEKIEKIYKKTGYLKENETLKNLHYNAEMGHVTENESINNWELLYNETPSAQTTEKQYALSKKLELLYHYQKLLYSGNDIKVNHYKLPKNLSKAVKQAKENFLTDSWEPNILTYRQSMETEPDRTDLLLAVILKESDYIASLDGIQDMAAIVYVGKIRGLPLKAILDNLPAIGTLNYLKNHCETLKTQGKDMSDSETVLNYINSMTRLLADLSKDQLKSVTQIEAASKRGLTINELEKLSKGLKTIMKVKSSKTSKIGAGK